MLLVVRYYNTVQAERAATSQARVIASAVLSASLVASDFEGPVVGARRSELDRLFTTQVFEEGVLLVTLYDRDGRVTYSTDHRLVGSRAEDSAHLEEALSGTIRGDVTSLREVAADGGEREVLRTYAPVAVEGGTGVVALFQDYAPIARAAQATFVPVVGIFEAVLIVLSAALVPILRRVTVRIRDQMREIERRALYDDLTGLPNRKLFGDRIEAAIEAAARDGGSSAVMLLDIDRFKEINDALGHETGDLLLREVGARLRGELPADETLARLGGDEFGILLSAASAEEAAVVAARLHAALERPFALQGLPLEVAISVGVAAYPEHGEGVDELLQHADVAMYLAKEAHAETAVYDPGQDTNDAARLALAGELRRAIENAELVLHFQPKADLQDGRIVGVEALVRWQHPERGLVPPNEFVPIAERTGLIKPLSRYVIAAALAQCAVLDAAGYDLHVALNLTMPDLRDLELPDFIEKLLAETRVRPDRLELEITESTLIADPVRVLEVLTRLDGLGVRLAIDDFGTGYSSLAYLKSLPVGTIKIDRSFVMGMCEDASDATIVRSTIDLARNLGLVPVAEGVESQDAWNLLRAAGCSLAQGYFIARPLPSEELIALLEERGERPAERIAAAAAHA